MKNINILKITSSYYPAIKFGGSVSADFSLDSELVKSGITIDVVTTNAGLNDIELHKWTDNNGINTIFLPFIGYEHFNLSFAYFKFLLLNVKKYKLLHISGIWNFPVLIAPIIARIYKIPYIITLHGTLLETAFSSKRKGLKSLLFKLFVKSNILNAQYIHVTSLQEIIDLKKLVNIDERKITSIPFGVKANIYNVHKQDEFKFRQLYNIETNDIIISFMGRIHPIKGLDMLFKAFEKLTLQCNNLKLLIIGPDDIGFKKELLDNISNKSKESIIFTGMLQDDQKNIALSSSDIFILPSYSENFGMTVVEAMSLNLPIIVTNKVGISTELTNEVNAIICETNENSIKEGLRKLISNQYLRSKLGNSGCELFHHSFSSKKIADKFIKIYKEMVNE